MTQLSKKDLVFVSFMLFSMFFGAGNLIFPPFLGQSAGEQVWLSLAGFIVSAVGIPILGVAAIAKTGSFQTLSSRVHPSFAFIFPIIIYLSIGPGLAIPRAGSLAFEMGVGPFLSEQWAANPVSLFLYTLVFFGIVHWLSMSPTKLVDRFGKFLTPFLLLLIAGIFITSLISPIGEYGAATGKYETQPVFQGFLDGYLTMDALAALVFGIVVANTLRAKGVDNTQKLTSYIIYAGLGAGFLLTVIYLILGFLGASASSAPAENGAQILTFVMNQLFGQSGTLILGAVFTLACLCVSIGLVTSCSQFFTTAFPKLSYSLWVKILCITSMMIANLGLTQILKVSVPILGAIYPIAIVLIILGLFDQISARVPAVYLSTVVFVAAFSITDTLNSTFAWKIGADFLKSMPLYAEGVGWLVPAMIGLVVGLAVALFSASRSVPKQSL